MGKAASALRSMTGFSSLRAGYDVWQIVADVRSVNGRGLDIRLRVPDWIEGLEPEIRKRLQASLARGNVTLNVRLSRGEDAGGIRVSEAGLRAALTALEQISLTAREAGHDVMPASVADIASMKGVIELREDADADTAPLKAAILAEVDGLIEAFDLDRAREGAALADVLAGQLSEVEFLVAKAEGALGDRAEAARAALERNLARLLGATDVPDEARLAQELALIAVKSDVMEELDRLRTHVGAARDLIGARGPVGRKLDFLMQEFNREANTLCSKAQSGELTAIGLDLKTVIDQMREQVQNIE